MTNQLTAPGKINAVAFTCVALLVVAFVAAQQPPDAGSQITARAFTVVDHGPDGGWVNLDQPGFRNIFIRKTGVASCVFYDAGRGPAAPYAHPIVLIKSGGQEYRLDCPDEEHAVRFIHRLTGEKPNVSPPN